MSKRSCEIKGSDAIIDYRQATNRLCYKRIDDQYYYNYKRRRFRNQMPPIEASSHDVNFSAWRCLWISRSICPVRLSTFNKLKKHNR